MNKSKRHLIERTPYIPSIKTDLRKTFKRIRLAQKTPSEVAEKMALNPTKKIRRVA